MATDSPNKQLPLAFKTPRVTQHGNPSAEADNRDGDFEVAEDFIVTAVIRANLLGTITAKVRMAATILKSVWCEPKSLMQLKIALTFNNAVKHLYNSAEQDIKTKGCRPKDIEHLAGSAYIALEEHQDSPEAEERISRGKEAVEWSKQTHALLMQHIDSIVEMTIEMQEEEEAVAEGGVVTGDALWKESTTAYIRTVLTDHHCTISLEQRTICFAENLCMIGYKASRMQGSRIPVPVELGVAAVAAQALPAVVPAGELWLDLFDPKRNIFDRTPGQHAGYATIGVHAKVAYKRLISLTDQKKCFLAHHKELALKMADADRDKRYLDVAAGLYSTLQPEDKNEDQVRAFVLRVLRTQCAWRSSITYGALMMQAFVMLVYLKEQNEKVTNTVARKIPGKKFKWVSRKETFLTRFLLTLVNCIMLGPKFDAIVTNITNTIGGFVEDNNPVYQYVVLPLMHMARLICPVEFRWYLLQKYEKLTVFKHIKNSLAQVTNQGIFTAKWAMSKIKTDEEGDGDGDIPFLAGLYLPHYRLMSFVCEKMDVNSKLADKPAEGSVAINCQDVKLRTQVQEGRPITIQVYPDGDPFDPWELEAVSYTKASRTLAVAQRGVASADWEELSE
jgi:hypothetical protein